MELTVIDAARLRLAQAASNGPWKRDSTTKRHHVIRVEPDGTAIATNDTTMAVCAQAVAPFEGEAIHFIPQSKIPKTANTGIISGDTLTTDKGDAIGLTYVDLQYPNYHAVLERIGEGREYPRADYGYDGKALYDLLSAHPDWPKKHYFRLRHLSGNSVVLDFGLEGVTVLLGLAMDVQP